MCWRPFGAYLNSGCRRNWYCPENVPIFFLIGAGCDAAFFSTFHFSVFHLYSTESFFFTLAVRKTYRLLPAIYGCRARAPFFTYGRIVVSFVCQLTRSVCNGGPVIPINNCMNKPRSKHGFYECSFLGWFRARASFSLLFFFFCWHDGHVVCARVRNSAGILYLWPSVRVERGGTEWRRARNTKMKCGQIECRFYSLAIHTVARNGEARRPLDDIFSFYSFSCA